MVEKAVFLFSKLQDCQDLQGTSSKGSGLVMPHTYHQVWMKYGPRKDDNWWPEPQDTSLRTDHLRGHLIIQVSASLFAGHHAQGGLPLAASVHYRLRGDPNNLQFYSYLGFGNKVHRLKFARACEFRYLHQHITWIMHACHCKEFQLMSKG